MAKKLDIGEVVASSMREILESESHQLLFNKTAAKKKCCACETKCAKKCPCKRNGGCKKSCDPCEALSKKASEKKCCDCVGKCGDKCPCAGNDGKTCSDCASCGDGRMSAKAALEMVDALLAISEEQDAAGLHVSAEQSYKSAVVLMKELEKKAFNSQPDPPGDENEVSVLDDVLPDDEFSGPESETPAVDQVFKDIFEKDPDFKKEMRKRLEHLNRAESVGSEDFDVENIPQLPSDTDISELEPEMDTDITELDPEFRSDTDISELAPFSQTMFEEILPPSKDEELDSILATDRLDTLVSKFAFDVDSDFEDDGVGLDEMFPYDAGEKSPPQEEDSDVDTMMDELLQQGDDEAFADDFEDEWIPDDEPSEVYRALVDNESNNESSKDELVPSPYAKELEEYHAWAMKEKTAKIVELMSYWSGGENDPLYRVMSMFNAGKEPALDDVASARDHVETLFNRAMKVDVLDLEPGDQLYKIHTFLVDYLKAKGDPEPGEYLDAGVIYDDSVIGEAAESIEEKKNSDMHMVDSYLAGL